MTEERPYEQIIKSYTRQDLLSIANSIDRNRFPERYKLVLDELDKRKEDAKKVISKNFRNEFAPTAKRYRVARRIFNIAALCVICLGFVVTHYNYYIVRMGLLLSSTVLGLNSFFLLLMPRLVCPSCHCKLECEVERFCPECGSPELELNNRCASCHKMLRMSSRWNRRLYKTRFCTTCRAHLDDKGV